MNFRQKFNIVGQLLSDFFQFLKKNRSFTGTAVVQLVNTVEQSVDTRCLSENGINLE